MSLPVTLGHHALTSQYEDLRSEALRGTGRGIGLTLFLRSGMKYWIEAWSNRTLQTPRESTDRPGLMVPASRSEITLILADMAFEHCQGGHP